MMLVIAPAIDGLKPEWREAAESLGATGRTYWLRVGLPVLAPSLLGAMVLLFGNAVAAQATAYSLTGGGYPLVTNHITNVINGNVLEDPHAGPGARARAAPDHPRRDARSTSCSSGAPRGG